MSEDLRVAYEMEAMLVKQYGLLVPKRCDCRFEVIASYPGRPWYFVKLNCKHTLRKQQPNLNDPSVGALVSNKFAWFTGSGEAVTTSMLQWMYDELVGPSWVTGKTTLRVSEDLEITRVGGVYYRVKDGTLKYDEPW